MTPDGVGMPGGGGAEGAPMPSSPVVTPSAAAAPRPGGFSGLVPGQSWEEGQATSEGPARTPLDAAALEEGERAAAQAAQEAVADAEAAAVASEGDPAGAAVSALAEVDPPVVATGDPATGEVMAADALASDEEPADNQQPPVIVPPLTPTGTGPAEQQSSEKTTSASNERSDEARHEETTEEESSDMVAPSTPLAAAAGGQGGQPPSGELPAQPENPRNGEKVGPAPTMPVGGETPGKAQAPEAQPGGPDGGEKPPTTEGQPQPDGQTPPPAETASAESPVVPKPEDPEDKAAKERLDAQANIYLQEPSVAKEVARLQQQIDKERMDGQEALASLHEEELGSIATRATQQAVLRLNDEDAERIARMQGKTKEQLRQEAELQLQILDERDRVLDQRQGGFLRGKTRRQDLEEWARQSDRLARFPLDREAQVNRGKIQREMEALKDETDMEVRQRLLARLPEGQRKLLLELMPLQDKDGKAISDVGAYNAAVQRDLNTIQAEKDNPENVEKKKELKRSMPTWKGAILQVKAAKDARNAAREKLKDPDLTKEQREEQEKILNEANQEIRLMYKYMRQMAAKKLFILWLISGVVLTVGAFFLGTNLAGKLIGGGK